MKGKAGTKRKIFSDKGKTSISKKKDSSSDSMSDDSCSSDSDCDTDDSNSDDELNSRIKNDRIVSSKKKAEDAAFAAKKWMEVSYFES